MLEFPITIITEWTKTCKSGQELPKFFKKLIAY